MLLFVVFEHDIFDVFNASFFCQFDIITVFAFHAFRDTCAVFAFEVENLFIFMTQCHNMATHWTLHGDY